MREAGKETACTLKPDKFPIGSLESRAAARAQLVCLNNSCKRLRIISSIPRPEWDNSRVRFGEWQEWQDNTLGQHVYVPHVWLTPEDPIPACSDCGTPFNKTREYRSMVGYKANCIDKHDSELLEQGTRRNAGQTRTA